MLFKIAPILLILYMCQFQFVIASHEPSVISNCFYYNNKDSNYSIENVPFICAGSDDNLVFVGTSKIQCSNDSWQSQLHYKWFGEIDLENCEFTKIKQKPDFSEMFLNVHTLIMSNVDLKLINMDTFFDALNMINFIIIIMTKIPIREFTIGTQLHNLDLSKNSIEQVDTFAFFVLKNVKSLDLSHNKLNNFHKNMFVNMSGLQSLNLSYNQNNKLAKDDLNFRSLTTLDLANNNLSVIERHAFDKLSHLNQLNLSSNPINEIRNETFARLFHLEHLILRQINVSRIERGTFIHQQKLISLDLSGNSLETFDFLLLHPLQYELKSLRLANNQLTELANFRHLMLLEPLLLDIQSNDFHCSYLENFMKSLDFEKIRLATDQCSMDKPNIRGINCNIHTPQKADTNQIGTNALHYSAILVIWIITLLFILQNLSIKFGFIRRINHAEIWRCLKFAVFYMKTTVFLIIQIFNVIKAFNSIFKYFMEFYAKYNVRK